MHKGRGGEGGRRTFHKLNLFNLMKFLQKNAPNVVSVPPSSGSVFLMDPPLVKINTAPYGEITCVKTKGVPYNGNLFQSHWFTSQQEAWRLYAELQKSHISFCAKSCETLWDFLKQTCLTRCEISLRKIAHLIWCEIWWDLLKQTF